MTNLARNTQPLKEQREYNNGADYYFAQQPTNFKNFLSISNFNTFQSVY